MTEKKEQLEKDLSEREAELRDVWDKFEKKSMEFINERQAHRLQIEANQRLEEEIKDLKRQIADLLLQIEGLNQTIKEKEEENLEHLSTQESLREQISKLEEKLENKKERWDVGIQVPHKVKNKETQTQGPVGPDGQPIGISSFGHVSDSAEGLHFMADHQTVNSTAMNSTHVGTMNLMRSGSNYPNAQSQGQVGIGNASQMNQVKRVQSATR